MYPLFCKKLVILDLVLTRRAHAGCYTDSSRRQIAECIMVWAGGAGLRGR